MRPQPARPLCKGCCRHAGSAATAAASSGTTRSNSYAAASGCSRSARRRYRASSRPGGCRRKRFAAPGIAAASSAATNCARAPSRCTHRMRAATVTWQRSRSSRSPAGGHASDRRLPERKAKRAAPRWSWRDASSARSLIDAADPVLAAVAEGDGLDDAVDLAIPNSFATAPRRTCRPYGHNTIF